MKSPMHRFKLPQYVSLINVRLLFRKPIFLVRATWYIIRKTFFHGDPLSGINFSSHYLCNLNCQHCYEKAFRKATPKSPLTLEEKVKILRDCIDMGLLNVTFVGGESSIDPDIETLIKACSPWKTYIQIASNGYALTEERIRYFRALGVDKICFSIDSMDPQIHDANRGKKGSHARVLQAIEDTLKLGLFASVQYVVYKDTTKTEDFAAMLRYAEGRNIRLQFKPAIPFGGLENQHNLAITDEDTKTMLQLHQKNPLFLRDSDGDGCPALQKTVTITPYGEVQPCNAVQVSFGNLRHEKLTDILKKGRLVPYFNGKYNGCPPAEDFAFIEMCKKNRTNPTDLPEAHLVFKVLQPPGQNGHGNETSETAHSTTLPGHYRKEKIMNWKNEIILITGPTSGLGEQLAIKAVSLGSRLILIARDQQKLEASCNKLQALGGVVHPFVHDLHDYEGIAPLYAKIVAEVGSGPTVLINNAGYNAAGFIVNTPAKVFDDNYRTNVFAPIALMQAVLPEMFKRDHGYIVNIMSAAMYHSFPGLASYCSSKTALGAIHESLQAELSSTGVKSLYVNPGSFRSNYFKNTRVDGRFQKYTYGTKAEHLRKDPKIVAEAIFAHMAQGKEVMNLGSYMDKVGHHLKYWAPGFLAKLLVKRNPDILNDRPTFR